MEWLRAPPTDELPPVLDAARKPPSRPTGKQLFDEDQDEDA
jgi:hypothetical protein